MQMQDLSEIIDIVDENNNVITTASRKEMVEKTLRHRSTFIFVIDGKSNKLVIQKRTMFKSWYPGSWDFTFGGVVGTGESYDLSAARELEEELGLKSKLIPLEEFYIEIEGSKCWGKSFYTIMEADCVPILQESEVEKIQIMSMEEINNMLESGEKVTPDSLIAYNKFLNNGFSII